jgi:hypothetical protein
MASGIQVPTDRAYETVLGHFGKFEAQRWFGGGVRHSSRHGAERFIALAKSCEYPDIFTSQRIIPFAERLGTPAADLPQLRIKPLYIGTEYLQRSVACTC